MNRKLVDATCDFQIMLSSIEKIGEGGKWVTKMFEKTVKVHF